MIDDLLLDVNVVVDVCVERPTHFPAACAALDLADRCGTRLWLYTGSVQALQYVIAAELRRKVIRDGQHISVPESHSMAAKLLREFAEGKQWLAALSEDGDVFSDSTPDAGQIMKAVKRLGDGARILTRDEQLLKRCPLAISVANFENDAKKTKSPRLPFIDLAEQQRHIRPQLEQRFHKIIHHGKYILGPEIEEVERKLADFVGCEFAVTCASGTDALLMPLMAHGVGVGDAVFTTPFTFIATAEVISLLGATPIFVDIDADTFNICPAELEQTILKVVERDRLRPRGIIPVDLFGLPAEYNEIKQIASRHDLFVIEDAAQGFGGRYHGRAAGNLGDIGATSFFPAKPLGCYGDGGAIFTNDENLAETLVSIRVHGQGADKYDNVRPGLNARFDTLQAAVLLSKLEIFPEELTFRNRIANSYTANIQKLSLNLVTPKVPEGLFSAWAQYSVLAEDRSTMRSRLSECGIPTAIYYPMPLHLQSAFSYLGYKRGDFPIAEEISAKVFSLPMHPYLRDADVDRIVNTMAHG